MDSVIAQESLSQRGRSDLFKDLVSLLEKSFNALSSSPEASHEYINITLKGMKFGESLKAIIKTHTNLKLKSVELIESSGPNAFAMLDIADKWQTAVQNNKTTFGMVISKLETFYDDRTAVANIPEDFNFPITMKMGIHTAFWKMRTPEGNLFFTPSETAAIILHEIGHFDHWIRSFLRIHSTLIDASDIVDFVKASPPRDEILEILAKLRKNRYLNKEWVPILNATEKYFSETNSFADAEYREALATLCLLIEHNAANASVAVINHLLIQRAWVPSSSVGNKLATRLHDIDAERSADEFASRNGGYADLTSALFKMDSLGNTNAKLFMQQYMWTAPAIVFAALIKFHALFSVAAEDIAFGYDPMFIRLKLICETAKHSFSNSDLPEDVKQDIRKQIQTCEAYLQQQSSAKHRVIRLAMKNWLQNVSKFGRIIGSPVLNRRAGDYERLQDATRILSRNPLYFEAQR